MNALDQSSKRIYTERPASHRFTHSYAQADDYRFCQDSVILPMFVAEDIRDVVESPAFRPETYRALDACAGCGVMGLELSHYLPTIQNIDFIEIQGVYRTIFHENLRITGRCGNVHGDAIQNFKTGWNFYFIEDSYDRLLDDCYRQRYDLIISNPPYFFVGEGKLSPSEIKNRSRFFLDSSLENLVRGIVHALKPGGRAYLLIKSGERHGRDTLTDIRKWVDGIGSTDNLLQISTPAEIRGTSVVRFLVDQTHTCHKR